MCDPASMAVTTAALSIGSAGMDYVAKSDAANQMNNYNSAQSAISAKYMAENAKSANSNLTNQYNLMDLRIQQEGEATSQQIQQNNIEAMKAKATATVAAGEAGVGGRSLDDLLYDYNRQNAVRNGVAQINLKNFGMQSKEEMKSMQADAQSKINSVQPYIPQPVNTPSAFAAVISGASSGLNTGIYTYNSVQGKYKLDKLFTK